MGMKVVCRYCKSKIEKKDALQITGEKNNTYFAIKNAMTKQTQKRKRKRLRELQRSKRRKNM